MARCRMRRATRCCTSTTTRPTSLAEIAWLIKRNHPTSPLYPDYHVRASSWAGLPVLGLRAQLHGRGPQQRGPRHQRRTDRRRISRHCHAGQRAQVRGRLTCRRSRCNSPRSRSPAQTPTADPDQDEARQRLGGVGSVPHLRGAWDVA